MKKFLFVFGFLMVGFSYQPSNAGVCDKANDFEVCSTDGCGTQSCGTGAGTSCAGKPSGKVLSDN